MWLNDSDWIRFSTSLSIGNKIHCENDSQSSGLQRGVVRRLLSHLLLGQCLHLDSGRGHGPPRSLLSRAFLLGRRFLHNRSSATQSGKHRSQTVQQCLRPRRDKAGGVLHRSAVAHLRLFALEGPEQDPQSLEQADQAGEARDHASDQQGLAWAVEELMECSKSVFFCFFVSKKSVVAVMRLVLGIVQFFRWSNVLIEYFFCVNTSHAKRMYLVMFLHIYFYFE